MIKITESEIEQIVLIAIRDTLLTKFMNGEIEV